MNAPDSLKLPTGLYALCDDSVRPDVELEAKAARLLEGGVRVIQLRLKRTPPRRAVQVARSIVAMCEQRGALCLLNDRVDWALVSGAHGVHVGAEDLAPEDVRRLLGPTRLVGVTVRDAEMSRRAKEAGADYAGLGPVFATSTKRVEAPVLGVEAFARVVAASPLPVVGIGGIGLTNIEQVAEAGAHGAAVLSNLLAAPDIAERARALAEAFERGRRRRTLPGQV